MAQKKYKIAVGLCPPDIIYTNIIKANDEREAVLKFFKEMGKEPTEQEIEDMIRHTIEHTPKPRKKKESV